MFKLLPLHSSGTKVKPLRTDFKNGKKLAASSYKLFFDRFADLGSHVFG